MVTASDGSFTAVLDSNEGGVLTSSLTTVARNGLMITCTNRGIAIGSETIMIQGACEEKATCVPQYRVWMYALECVFAGLPSPPVNIRHSVHRLASNSSTVAVTVQWDPVDGVDNYTVTISPSAQLSATVVTSTSVTVSAANYNEDYTVSVVATNCAGNSTAEEYSFRVGEFSYC